MTQAVTLSNLINHLNPVNISVIGIGLICGGIHSCVNIPVLKYSHWLMF